MKKIKHFFGHTNLRKLKPFLTILQKTKTPFPNQERGLPAPSAGIEPTFQEPESCVLSVAPRGQKY